MCSHYKKLVLICLLSVVFLLSACAPFVDARREAGVSEPVGSSTDDNPAICYGLFGSQADIDALAANECAKTGRKAVLKQKENFACYLFTPQKAVYECEQSTEPVPPYKPTCSISR